MHKNKKIMIGKGNNEDYKKIQKLLEMQQQARLFRLSNKAELKQINDNVYVFQLHIEG